jgi:AraC family transcriptional regulator
MNVAQMRDRVQMQQYVHDNLHSKLKWDQIAAALGMEKFRFGRAFKLATGISPRQYVIRCRVMRAMGLLARGAGRPADVARAVGCSNQSHLTNLFRKHIGTTPGAFRRAAALGRLRHVH